MNKVYQKTGNTEIRLYFGQRLIYPDYEEYRKIFREKVVQLHKLYKLIFSTNAFKLHEKMNKEYKIYWKNGNKIHNHKDIEQYNPEVVWTCRIAE